jgi:hypothetical protein
MVYGTREHYGNIRESPIAPEIGVISGLELGTRRDFRRRAPLREGESASLRRSPSPPQFSALDDTDGLHRRTRDDVIVAPRRALL